MQQFKLNENNFEYEQRITMLEDELNKKIK